MNIGWQEILLILLLVLLLFGARRIPEVASSIGKGIREFRRAMHQLEGEEKEKKGTHKG